MSNTLTGREVLRLITDGVSLDDIEYKFPNFVGWAPMSSGGLWHVNFILDQPDGVQFRRKAKTRVVNGFTVPAPEEKAPKPRQEYWVPDTCDRVFCADLRWGDAASDSMLLERGLVFLDKDAAIANAKAMCGIDPHQGEEK